MIAVGKLKQLGQAFMDAQITVPIPHVAAVVLALAAGAAEVLNQTTFVLPAAWHAYLGLGVVAVAYLGVKPLVGPQFREALHLPPAVTKTITALIAAGTVAAGSLPVSDDVRGALAGATAALIGLGFGPAGSQIAAQAKQRRAAKRAAATRRARAASS